MQTEKLRLIRKKNNRLPYKNKEKNRLLDAKSLLFSFFQTYTIFKKHFDNPSGSFAATSPGLA